MRPIQPLKDKVVAGIAFVIEVPTADAPFLAKKNQIWYDNLVKGRTRKGGIKFAYYRSSIATAKVRKIGNVSSVLFHKMLITIVTCWLSIYIKNQPTCQQCG